MPDFIAAVKHFAIVRQGSRRRSVRHRRANSSHDGPHTMFACGEPWLLCHVIPHTIDRSSNFFSRSDARHLADLSWVGRGRLLCYNMLSWVGRDIYNVGGGLTFLGYPPTASPTQETPGPTQTPSLFPTRATYLPTALPTYIYCPSETPTSPSLGITLVPSPIPTPLPSRYPTLNPSIFPTNKPSLAPTRSPTSKPSLSPTDYVSTTRYPTLYCQQTPNLNVPCQIVVTTPTPTTTPAKKQSRTLTRQNTSLWKSMLWCEAFPKGHVTSYCIIWNVEN